MTEYRAIFEDIQGYKEIGEPKNTLEEALEDRGVDDNTGGMSGKTVVGIQTREVDPWTSMSLGDLVNAIIEGKS